LHSNGGESGAGKGGASQKGGKAFCYQKRKRIGSKTLKRRKGKGGTHEPSPAPKKKGEPEGIARGKKEEHYLNEKAGQAKSRRTRKFKKILKREGRKS